MKVLVVGGTGGFGQVICRQLDAEGHRVVAVGRTPSKAIAMTGEMPRLQFVKAERSAIDPAFIRNRGIEVVVDASGPFQNCDLNLIHASIFAGVHYLDIADDRDFIDRASRLAPEARAAGIVMVPGASSTPGVSGAAAALCARYMTRVDRVEVSITASNRAAFGDAVLEAMLSRAGRSMTAADARVQMALLRRIDMRLPRIPRLSRTVLRCESPDMDFMRLRFGSEVTTTFWAGGEHAWQNHIMQGVSKLVSMGWMKDGRAILPAARLARRIISSSGDGRSGMMVEVEGMDASGRTIRTWTLIAEGNQGPIIPALVVPAIVTKISKDAPRSGLHSAADLITIEAIANRMPAGSVKHGVRDRRIIPLHVRVMGREYDLLHPSVAEVHSGQDGVLEGTADIEGPANWLGRVVSLIFGFPRSGTDVPVRVSFQCDEQGETWTRTFGTKSFSSRLTSTVKGIEERFGPFRFAFDVREAGGGLQMIPTGWSVFGIPLPTGLQPSGIATETGGFGQFRFDVPVTMPLIGRIVHYRGRLNVPARISSGRVPAFTDRVTWIKTNED